MSLKLVYLQEEKVYRVDELCKCITVQLSYESDRNGGEVPIPAGSGGDGFDVSKLDKDFFMRLKKSMDQLPKENRETSVVEIGTDDSKPTFKFKFIGLYDYVDRPDGEDMGTETNLTFFFMPKFVAMPEFENEKTDWIVPRDTIRDTVLQAIDQRNRGLSKSDDQIEETEERRESLLERAVRLLRDYLENSIYTVQRRELEHNGQGEIDWETTIDQYQPVFLKKGGKARPFYMDYATELAWSDEEHYITRLHQCLVTTWGRKLEELGLSSVLRVNVPPLSEEELDWFGEPDYQIAQIDKELRLQFVTKSRHTLSLMKDLIREMAENKAANRQSLSFGMNGVAQLWETACAAVLGSELDKQIQSYNPAWDHTETFREYMPKPMWQQINGSNNTEVSEGDEQNAAEGSIKSGWKLDFIRTYPSDDKKNVDKLVIFDAKYYNVSWSPDGKQISKQPSIGDIAKQIFYQMAFKDLVAPKSVKADKKPTIVNAFLFPEDDNSDKCQKDGKGLPTIRVSELVRLGWKNKGNKLDVATGFQDANQNPICIFGVRIPGIELLKRYANGDTSDDWFEKIVGDCEKFNPQSST